MGQAVLVDNQIDDGREVVERLASNGFDVTAAAWVKPSEDDRWFLYIASKEVDAKGLTAAFGALRVAMEGMNEPWLSVFEVKFIRTTDPITKDLLDIQRRHPGPFARRSRPPRLGDLATDEVYVYPPIADTGPDARWYGISVMVFPEGNGADAYRVEFWPRQVRAALRPGGQPSRVPRPASVRVVGGQVADYRSPEQPLPHVSQSDYEQKALEAVTQLAGTPA
jgi:hypothetical protein